MNEEVTEEKTCPRCNGKGKIKDSGSGFRKSAGVFILLGVPSVWKDEMKRCGNCSGRGKVK